MAIGPMTPVPTDSNGWKLTDKGTELLTDKITVTNAAWSDVSFGTDIKEFACYVSTGDVYIRGMSPASTATIDPVAVIDNGDGTVTFGCAAHGFTTDGTAQITIYGSTNYNTTYTLLAASGAGTLVVTATYVAETPSGAYAVGYRDPPIPNGASFGASVAKKDPQSKGADNNAIGREIVFSALAAGAGGSVLSLLMWR